MNVVLFLIIALIIFGLILLVILKLNEIDCLQSIYVGSAFVFFCLAIVFVVSAIALRL